MADADLSQVTAAGFEAPDFVAQNQMKQKTMQVRTANWGDAAWVAVSAQAPCPICTSNEGCQVHEEDDFASCRRVPSVWPLVNGAWLHRTRPPLTDDEQASQAMVHQLGSSELRAAG